MVLDKKNKDFTYTYLFEKVYFSFVIDFSHSILYAIGLIFNIFLLIISLLSIFSGGAFNPHMHVHGLDLNASYGFLFLLIVSAIYVVYVYTKHADEIFNR